MEKDLGKKRHKGNYEFFFLKKKQLVSFFFPKIFFTGIWFCFEKIKFSIRLFRFYGKIKIQFFGKKNEKLNSTDSVFLGKKKKGNFFLRIWLIMFSGKKKEFFF